VQAALDSIYGKGSIWYECQEREGNLEAIAYAESISRKALKFSIGTFATQAQELQAQVDELNYKLANARSPAQRNEYIAQIQDLEKARLEAHQRTAEVTAEFLKRYPNDQDAYLYRYILADSYFNAGEFEKAGTTFAEVRDISDGRFRRAAANGAIDSNAIVLAKAVEGGQSDPRGLPPGVIKEMYAGGVIPASQVPSYLLRESQKEGTGDQAAAEAELAAREGQPVEREEIPADVV